MHRRRYNWTKTALGAVILIALLAACDGGPGTPGPQGPPGPPGRSLNWADVIEDGNLAHAIYAIGVSVPGEALCQLETDPLCLEELSGEIVFFPVGTGFAAHYPNTIWTNAHVADGVRETMRLMREEISAFEPVPLAVRAGTSVGGAHSHPLDLDASLTHPDYDDQAQQSPDLAVFHLDGAPFQDVPAFLPRQLATALRVGQPIATLGFPGELSDPFSAVPIATFKEGTISALRPYSSQESPVTPEISKVVQFNFGQTGGTSGSPVFDHQGFIVAVSFAGIETEVGVDGEGFPIFIPISGLDFGVRVDEVWAMVDLIEAAGEPPAARVRDYPSPTYRAFPEDWDGRTLSSHAAEGLETLKTMRAET